MKKTIIGCAVLILLFSKKSYCQQQERMWMFGEAAALDFSGTAPVAGTIPNAGGAPPAWEFQRSGAVCSATGQLLFWVKLQNNTGPNAASIPNVFTAAGQPMPNGNLLSQMPGQGVPVIVPAPGSATHYYVFYIKSGGLHYSVVDMSLNGGQGDVTSQKNILLGSYSSLIDQKITAIEGCNCVWLVVRSRNENKYFSYRISKNGVDTNPVVSVCGLLPLSRYGGLNQYSGVIKAAKGGSKIAAACVIGVPGSSQLPKGGIELYDFEPCSGLLRNPIVIDSGAYFGVCFSPDNSKLYATALFDRKLYQFDLSLVTPAAIVASKTLVLTNPSYGTSFPQSYMPGDLKRGLDGKIYLGNNVCADFPYTNAMHVIGSPNLAGVACNPTLNALLLGSSGACTGLLLPADIVSAPEQDTLIGATQYLSACFRDSLQLTAPQPGGCYRWNDSIRGPALVVTQPGLYLSTYTDNNCSYHIDSYLVSFPKLPIAGLPGYSCPGSKQGTLYLTQFPGDTTIFTYQWRDQAGNVLATRLSHKGDTLAGLDPGTYRVQIITPAGCDTTLELQVVPLPVPDASFIATDHACKGDSIVLENTSAAPIGHWYFPPQGSSVARRVTHTFYSTGIHTVWLVVKNPEGCTDSASHDIDVHSLELRLFSDKEYASRGEAVRLETLGSEPYSISMWAPRHLFSDQAAPYQTIYLDTTQTIIVAAASNIGCRDTASLQVRVKPHVMIPSAFSPNNDGLNDLFRVTSWGEPVFIRFFEVYNRWGQCVYKATGRTATGWDGSYKGQPAETGTYFYTIEIELPDGKTWAQKGDVTLIR